MRTQQHSEHPTFEKVWQMHLETEKKFREADKRMNKLEYLFTSQWGKLIESLVEGDLIKLLHQRGIDVQRTHTRSTYNYNSEHRGEIDIIAEDGNEVVVVEVKTTLRPEDITEFLDTLKIFKKAFPKYKENIVYGAMAYLNTESKADVRAERMGMFVIRATGNSASIINEKKFKPKAF